MSISYVIHRAHRLFTTKYVGHISDDEFVATYRKIYGEPSIEPGFAELADVREITTFDAGALQMRQIATMSKRFHGHQIHKAMVAQLVSSEFQLGLSRMYGAYSETGNSETARIFESLAEALEWLGVVDLPFDRLHGK
jgi:hypothetical protein